MTSTASETSSTPRDPYRDNFSLTFSFFDNKTTKWRDDKKKSNNAEVHPLQTAKIVGSTSSKNLLVFAEKNGTIHSIDTIHYQHNTFQAFDKTCMAVKILTKYEVDESKTVKKNLFEFSGETQTADPSLIQYLVTIGSDKAPKEERPNDDEEETYVREDVCKVKVFAMRHEAFRTVFDEKYFFYLLPNSKNNGPRHTVKNLKGDLGISCFEVSDDFKHMAVYLSNAKQPPLNIYGEIIFFKMEGNQTFLIDKPSSVPTPVQVTVNTSTEVTNLGFLRNPAGGYNLFATTLKSVYNCIISERFASINRLNFTVIDPRIGANVGCATIRTPGSTKIKSKLTQSPASFLVANKAGLFAYGEDGALQRSEERSMEGLAPTMVLNDCNYATQAKWFRNYLVLSIKRDNDHTLKVYELSNKYVCYEYEISSLASSYMLGSQTNQQAKLKPTYQVLEVVPMFDMADVNSSGAIYLLVREMRSAQIDDEIPQESTNLLIRLREKPIDVQLDLLIKKYKFTYALDLAKETSAGLDVEIRKKYGDYRFSLGQYRRAINQYVLTIGKLEPSYVIRKFLDETNSKNQYLIQYLYALHRENAFNNDHTTLLLNCFMRLDENVESGEFAREMKMLHKKETEEDGLQTQEIVDDLEQAPDAATQNLLRLVQLRDKVNIIKMFMDSHETLKYDPETVIKVLRSNGYKQEARKLAERFAKERNDKALHDWVLQINIEDATEKNDKANLRRALRHIESLPLDLAKYFSKKYAKVLLAHLPNRMTNLLIRTCTDLYRPIPAYADGENVNDLSRVFVLPEYKKTFYEMCGQNYSMEEFDTHDVQQVRATIDPKELAKPSDYIFAFVDQPFWLMVFLEVVTTYAQNGNNVNPQTQRRTNEIDGVVYNTLLELYLRYWDNDSRRMRKMLDFGNAPLVAYVDAEKNDPTPNKNDFDSDFYYQIFPVERNQLEESYEQKAKTLIERDSDQYDPNHALMLCQSKNFEYGILYLYKRMNLKYDILQFYMEMPVVVDDQVEGAQEELERKITEKFEKILETAYEYGDEDPNIWIQVLSFFTNGRGSTYVKSTEYITKVLLRIKEKDVLPPLQVVKILSKNQNVKVSHLREYLYSKLHRDQEKTKEQNKTIKELQKESTKLNSEIEELRRNAQIFQSTQCSGCAKTLNLPAVHFMCMHSYHQRCLENDQCPKCSEKNKIYVAELEKIKRSKDAKTGVVQEKIETFTQQLTNHKQGFEALANQFGTGLFSQSQFEDFNDDFLLKSDSDRLML